LIFLVQGLSNDSNYNIAFPNIPNYETNTSNTNLSKFYSPSLENLSTIKCISIIESKNFIISVIDILFNMISSRIENDSNYNIIYPIISTQLTNTSNENLSTIYPSTSNELSKSKYKVLLLNLRIFLLMLLRFCMICLDKDLSHDSSSNIMHFNYEKTIPIMIRVILIYQKLQLNHYYQNVKCLK